jgi:two-component system, chemotaxis family, CheB/CheR fusion protein
MQAPQSLEQARNLCESQSFGHEEFMALLSHELRTPLGALIAASEVLGTVVPGSPDDAEARAVVARQVRRLRYVLDELVQVGRTLSAKQEA